MFGFMMAGLAIAPLVLLLFLWMEFREGLGVHPIYRRPEAQAQEKQPRHHE